MKSAFADRLALHPSGQSQNPVAILFLVPNEVGSATGGNLARYGCRPRQRLTTISSRTSPCGDNSQWTVIAPHAIYFREAWTGSGTHVTDTHVARRIDPSTTVC